MQDQVDTAVAVDVHGMDIDFVAGGDDFQMPTWREVALTIAELEGDAGAFMEPIDFAVAVEVNHGVDPGLAGDDSSLPKA
jgi:hypothetical protein